VYWAAWCNTWLLIKLTRKGVVFSFLFKEVCEKMLETMLKKQHNQAHDSLSSWQLAAHMLRDACHGVYHAIA